MPATPVPVLRWATASATVIDPADEKARRAAKKRRAGWQDEAFVVAAEIGEIRNAARFNSNAMSKLRMFAGHQAEPDQPVLPLDPENTDQAKDVTPEEIDVCNETMERLRSPERDQQQIVADIAMQIFLTGEGYLVQRDDDDGERFDFYSIQECVAGPGGWLLEIDDGERMQLGDDVGLSRIHVGSPDRRYKADSAMRAMVGECRALDLLTRSINAAAMSRLNAGILKIPEEMSFAAVQPGADGDEDELIADLIEHFTTPITDPDSAAAVVPFLLKAKRELLDGVQWISIARDFDKFAVQLRAELLQRIANGLELPADALTSRADINHWSAWSISEDTFRYYFEPRALMIASALTTAFLRPQLLLAGVEDVDRFRVGFDKSDLVAHPNQVAVAKDDWTDGLISDDARRRVNGWGDDDAPSEEELKARREFQKPPAPPQPVQVVAPPSDVTQAAKEPKSTDGSTPETVTKGPPKAPVTGAARTTSRLNRLSYRLLDIERQTRTRLLTASDIAVARALERAGARTRAKGKRDATVAASLKAAGDPDNCVLVAALGRQTVFTRLALTETNLVDDAAFTALESQWEKWVGGAQDAMLNEIGKLGSFGGLTDTFDYRAGRDRASGWAVLNEGLLATGRKRLFGLAETDTPPRGEYDPNAVVTPGLVRHALTVAGEGSGTLTPGGSFVTAAVKPPGAKGGVPVVPPIVRPLAPSRSSGKVPGGRGGVAVDTSIAEDILSSDLPGEIGAALGGQPAIGLTSGELFADAIAAAGARRGAMEWVHGDPKFPFEPHDMLDGEEFSSWTDEKLTNDLDWPDFDFFFPGDHEYCTCDYLQLLD